MAGSLAASAHRMQATLPPSLTAAGSVEHPARTTCLQHEVEEVAHGQQALGVAQMLVACCKALHLGGNSAQGGWGGEGGSQGLK